MSGAGLLGVVPLAEWDWPTLKTFVIRHGRWIVFCPPSCRPEAAAIAAQHGLWLRAVDSQRVSLEPKLVIRGDAHPVKERGISNAKTRVRRPRAAAKEENMTTAAAAVTAGELAADPLAAAAVAALSEAPNLFDWQGLAPLTAFLGDLYQRYFPPLWEQLSPEERQVVCQFAWAKMLEHGIEKGEIPPLAAIMAHPFWQMPLPERQEMMACLEIIGRAAGCQARADAFGAGKPAD